MKKILIIPIIFILTGFLFYLRFSNIYSNKNKGKNNFEIMINNEKIYIPFKNENEKILITKGIEAYEKGNYLEAINIFKNYKEAEIILLDSYRNEIIKKMNDGNFTQAYNLLYEAYNYNGKNPEINFLLGLYYYKVKEPLKAKGYFEYVLNECKDYNPSNSFYLTLIKIYYYNDELEKAEKLINSIINKNRTPDLEFWAKKISDELQIEKKFYVSKTQHFIIKYDSDKLNLLGNKVINTLENIYPVLARKLQVSSNENIIVILYLKQQFFNITKSPSWVGGFFDGKIRIPAGGDMVNSDEFSSILQHELTHALIYQKVKYNIPIWFNEGIAQYLQYFPDKLEVIKENELSIQNDQLSLRSLDAKNTFLDLNDKDSKSFYDKSLSIVHYIVYNYGFEAINRILDHLANGYSSENAFKEILHVNSFEQLEEEWLRWRKEYKK